MESLRAGWGNAEDICAVHLQPLPKASGLPSLCTIRSMPDVLPTESDIRPLTSPGTRRPAPSIRTLLLQLLIVALLPTLALLAYSGWASYGQARSQAEQSAAALANLTSDSVENFLDTTRQTMAQLASRPNIVAMDPDRCDPIFADFKDLFPRFANFSQANLQGELICSSSVQPAGKRTGIAQTAWYRQVIETQSFVVASPYLGPVTGKVVSVLAHPVKDAQGQLRGSIQLPVDLVTFTPVVGAAQLPESTVITVIDSRGVVVARSREAQNYVGKNLANTPTIAEVLKRRSGTSLNVTSSGVERIFGFQPIPGTNWYAIAGIATDAVLGPARRAALRDSLIVAGICVVALSVALRGRRHIVRPIDALRDTAQRIGAGETGLRAPTHGPVELVAVATQFNAMLDASAADSRALAQREAEYRLLFDSSLEGIVRSRSDGQILRANPAACHLLGIPAEAVGQTRWLDRVAPGDTRLAPLLAAVQRQGSARGELRLQRPDGTQVDCAASLTSTTAADGTVALDLFLNDLSDRTQKEEMRVSKEAAELASREKSAFLARMSHELRTPLNAILGFGQLLQLDRSVATSDKSRQMVDHVLVAGTHLLALIDDVLDLSRIEAGGLSLSLEPVPVLPLLQECTALMADVAAQRGITVRIEAEDSEACWIRGDVTRTRQVLVNLLGNAIKYNRPGGAVQVRVSAAAQTVHIAIRDTGTGLSAEQQAGLFQPFNRLGAERSGVEGTGLGLVIVQRLLTAMQASIQIDSRVGEGSTFTLSFQRSAAPVARPPATAPVAELPPPPRRGGTLLYIEDHEPNAVLMRAVLEGRPGLRLVTAADGASGIAAAQRLRPDLLLLDINLPDMDGHEVLRQLRADPATAEIPCIAISANAMFGDAETALAQGFQAYVVKPFSVPDLLASIDAWLA